MKTICRQLLSIIALGAAVAVSSSRLPAQEPVAEPPATLASSATDGASLTPPVAAAAGEDSAAGDDATAATGGLERKPSRGRLPAYFASLVDSRQREAIYAIRLALAPRIAALQTELEALRAAEMQQMEAVLSETQREQLQLRRAARAAATSKDPATSTDTVRNPEPADAQRPPAAAASGS